VIIPVVLSFAGGVLVGALMMWLATKTPRSTKTVNIPEPVVNLVTCQPFGQVKIEGTIAAVSPPAGMQVTFKELRTHIYDDPAASVPADPEMTSVMHTPNTSFSLVRALPLIGLAGAQDLAVVWAVYTVSVRGTLAYDHCA
jgi:hypothetical protein